MSGSYKEHGKCWRAEGEGGDTRRQGIRMKIWGRFYTWGNAVTQRIVYGAARLVAGICRQMGVASR